MNEEENVVSKKEIENAKAQQAGKDVADVAGKAAATYFGGAIGSKAYDYVSKTKMGQKALDNAGNNLTKTPSSRAALSKLQPAIEQSKPLVKDAIGTAGGGSTGVQGAPTGSGIAGNSSLTNASGSNSTGGLMKPNSFNSSTSSEEGKGNKNSISSDFNKTKKVCKIVLPVIGILFLLIVFLLFIYISLSGLLYLKEIGTETGEKMLNMFSGCGWSDDEECNKKLQNNFYEEVQEQYKKYKKDYNIKINRALIVSTLTYSNPFLTTNPEASESGEEFSSTTVDYKKSKKQVKKLVSAMLWDVSSCYLINNEGNFVRDIDCDADLTEYPAESYSLVKDTKYDVDEEKFRAYLEGNLTSDDLEYSGLEKEGFIIKYYLGGVDTEENRRKAKSITDTIFARASLFADLDDVEDDSGITYIENEINVSITDDTGNLVLETVPLEDYLKGVLYMQSDGNSSLEYLKFLAITSKNYLYGINGGEKNSLPINLRIKNSERNQIYCNIGAGCHYIDYTGNKSDIVVSGSDENGNYLKGPIEDIILLDNIEIAIEDTLNYFLVDDNTGNILSTQYDSRMQNSILKKLDSSGYQEVLMDLYSNTSIEELEINTTGYPLDPNNNYVTSLFGWRLHPVYDSCKYHNGIDIGADPDDNIYAAASGVVVNNVFNSSYGNYIVIGHGDYYEDTDTYDYYTLYAHQIRLSTLVKIGDTVTAGQHIGDVGSTGISTGPHLHFEVYTLENGDKRRSDPVLYFRNIELTGLDTSLPLYESESACNMAN